MSIETIVNGESTIKIKVTEVTFLERIPQDVFTKPVAGG